MDSSLSEEINKLFKQRLEKKVQLRFDAENAELTKRILEVNQTIRREQEEKEEALRDLEFTRFIERRLDDEYKDTNKLANKNFNYLHDKNCQGFLLYPPVNVTVDGWSGGRLMIRREVDRRKKFLLEPFESSEDDQQKKIIHESLLKEGEISRSLIPGPFQAPLMYLGISVAFFIKFWKNLE